MARAGDKGSTLWRTHNVFLQDDSLVQLVILITHFLLGLAPYIHLRLMNITSLCELDPALCDIRCDHENMAIQNVARFLKGADDWQTAINIYDTFKRGVEFAIEAAGESIEYRMYDNLAYVMMKRPFLIRKTRKQ